MTPPFTPRVLARFVIYAAPRTPDLPDGALWLSVWIGFVAWVMFAVAVGWGAL